MYKWIILKQNINMKKSILIILILLMIISIINNYYSLIDQSYFIKQIIWFLLGFLVLFLLFKLNINLIYKNSFYLYIFGNILLVLTLLIGPSINGSRAWLMIGPLSIQPSEFMKIFLILYLRRISLKYNNAFKFLLISFMIVLIPSILTFLEPDSGAVIFYLIIYLIFLIIKKMNKWYYISFIIIFILGISTFSILYFGYQNTFIKIFGTSFFYRLDRISSFIKRDGYQLNEALKSTSSSGLFGIKNKIYFPESTTDFAFSLLISNFGIIGLSFFIIIYSIFIILISFLKGDKYLKYTFLGLIVFQYIINALMNIGLFPIIGITLPFLSYGGSSLLSYFILLGFLLNKKACWHAYL